MFRLLFVCVVVSWASGQTVMPDCSREMGTDVIHCNWNFVQICQQRVFPSMADRARCADLLATALQRVFDNVFIDGLTYTINKTSLVESNDRSRFLSISRSHIDDSTIEVATDADPAVVLFQRCDISQSWRRVQPQSCQTWSTTTVNVTSGATTNISLMSEEFAGFGGTLRDDNSVFN